MDAHTGTNDHSGGPAPAIVVMGVSSSGKSSVGKALADSYGLPFVDGDAFHPESNIVKMKAGIPLNDDDRKGWLEALSRELSEKVASGTGVVLACSALKVAYRNILRQPQSQHDSKVVDFVFVQGSFELLTQRSLERTGHFMNPKLLQSQFDTLQVPTEGEAQGTDLKEGKLVTVDVVHPINELVSQIRASWDMQLQPDRSKGTPVTRH